MIVKTKRGHQVQSEEGKPLSQDNLTREQAEKRLAQVERMKHFRDALTQAHATAPGKKP